MLPSMYVATCYLVCMYAATCYLFCMLLLTTYYVCRYVTCYLVNGFDLFMRQESEVQVQQHELVIAQQCEHVAIVGFIHGLNLQPCAE